MSRDLRWVGFDDIEAKNGTDKGFWATGFTNAKGEPLDDLFVPFSQIDKGESEVLDTGDVGTLIVTDWWAEQNDLDGVDHGPREWEG